jgi:hypothetical protein
MSRIHRTHLQRLHFAVVVVGRDGSGRHHHHQRRQSGYCRSSLRHSLRGFHLFGCQDAQTCNYLNRLRRHVLIIPGLLTTKAAVALVVELADNHAVMSTQGYRKPQTTCIKFQQSRVESRRRSKLSGSVNGKGKEMERWT